MKGLSTSGTPIVLPLHPRTRRRLQEFSLEIPPNIMIVEPVGYLDMMPLEHSAKIIATDGEGVQNEAYSHSVACITIRDETEWVELVEIGANQLVGADSEKIANALSASPRKPNPSSYYGTGDASTRIAEHLMGSFHK